MIATCTQWRVVCIKMESYFSNILISDIPESDRISSVFLGRIVTLTFSSINQPDHNCK